ncbi:glycosyltransferase family 2 protein [Rhizobium sp. C1]|uniref:glycosyltransferase family 2 protein n=1 Tax=Rhizobium sp. C1 TaxID=1349799 RepID=UPI001E539B05|nr:glycosyltransferase family 2 protein [Rhizobium sp. C1]MCD2179742.1 glycosyltransferase family 2 protein [Rhizobium sp. C1]
MSSIDSPLRVSIVAPCYNEEDVIEEFARRALATGRVVAAGSFELVLVDDGSRDATWSKIEHMSRENPEIVGVRLMRNHGHELASTAGIASSRGARVLLIDADLQDPPELLGDMMAIMDRGADVVYGQRGARKGESWMKLTTSAIFYRLLRWLASVDIPSDTGDFRLMTRRVAELLLSMPERDRFLRGMISWIGGRQVPIIYERDQRHAGTTKYSYSKLLRLALDAITGFSARPLRIASWAGVVTAFIALCLLGYTFYSFEAGWAVTGWSSTMVAITVFSAVQLITLGILGEYIGRLVQQSKGRPLYMVDRVVRDGEEVPLVDCPEMRSGNEHQFRSRDPFLP